jgi:hypothetical protein
MAQRPSEPDQERWWFGKAVAYGLLSAVALLALGHWIPVLRSHNVYVAAAMTGGLAWALMSTFRRDWPNTGFWVMFGLLFVVHLALMWRLVISRATRIERDDALSISIPEVAAMTLLLIFSRACNYFAPKKPR